MSTLTTSYTTLAPFPAGTPAAGSTAAASTPAQVATLIDRLRTIYVQSVDNIKQMAKVVNDLDELKSDWESLPAAKGIPSNVIGRLRLVHKEKLLPELYIQLETAPRYVTKVVANLPKTDQQRIVTDGGMVPAPQYTPTGDLQVIMKPVGQLNRATTRVVFAPPSDNREHHRLRKPEEQQVEMRALEHTEELTRRRLHEIPGNPQCMKKRGSSQYIAKFQTKIDELSERDVVALLRRLRAARNVPR